MVFKKVKKYVKNQAKRAYGYAKQRYAGNGHLDFGKIVKDLNMVKTVLNSEKHRNIQTYDGERLGQLDQNTCGLLIKDITNDAAIGDGYLARSGASVKNHSIIINGQMYQQESCVNKISIKYFIIEVLGTPIDPISVDHPADEIFCNNPLCSNTIYDYMSKRNPDYYSKFKIHKRGRLSVARDQVSGQENIQPFKICHTFNKGHGLHTRWDKATTDLATGQLLFIMIADNGNIAANASTDTGAFVTAAYTGLMLNFTLTQYFYDN